MTTEIQNQPSDPYFQSDEYGHFTEQVRAIFAQHGKQIQDDLIHMYWEVGKEIREEVNRVQIDVTKLVQFTAVSISKSIRTVWEAVDFYDEHPDLEGFLSTQPDGVPWTNLKSQGPHAQIKAPEPTVPVHEEGVEILKLSSVNVKQSREKQLVELRFNKEKYLWIASEENLDKFKTKLGWTRIEKSHCPNPAGHQDCVEYINSVGKKFPDYPKQIGFLHKIINAGYSFNQMDDAMADMDIDRFYKEKGWDFADLSSYLGRHYADKKTSS
jgi:hypothetical protein